MEVLIVVVGIALLIIYFKRQDFQERTDGDSYRTVETNDKDRLKGICDRMIEYTVSLGDELDKHGRSPRCSELASIINLNLKEIERLRIALGHNQVSNIMININGNNQPFPVYLFGLYQILKELEEVSGYRFNAI